MEKSESRYVSFLFTCSVIFALLIVALPTASQAQVERKLVVVPGIVGSVLQDQTGKTIWGNASSLRRSRFEQLNLLPSSGAPVPLAPSDVLREVPLVFGSFQVDLYSDLIDFLVGKRSVLEAISGNEIRGSYREGETLFVFAYDWRRSNFANAKALNDFIAQHIPAGEEFDLVAHSMGGLVTRIMLGEVRPDDVCTNATKTAAAGLSDSDLNDLCHAVYGSTAQGPWPSDELSGDYPSADRMHTFIEIAVPHYGSVNVAGTLLDGWGKLSDIFTGGLPVIQNTVLSMTAPFELIPTYENCCARGVAHADGNIPIDPLDEEYWARFILGFEETPCPYDRCGVKRQVLRIGLNNRGLIDQVMNNGLPNTIKANHVVIGRMVKNTKETVYVAENAPGNGVGVTYRVGSRGDGTVFEASARPPGNPFAAINSNEGAVMRSKHPFIVGHESTENYIYNFLIDPISLAANPVSSTEIAFAGGFVESVGLSVTPEIAAIGQPLAIKLEMREEANDRFDETAQDGADLRFEVANYESKAVVAQGPMAFNEDLSFVDGLEWVFENQAPALTEPGVYTVSVKTGQDVISEEYLYVVEE